MDIVERLRNFETTNVDLLFLKNDAALEIERLREALRIIRDGLGDTPRDSEMAYEIADAALKEKE